jgi:hypothetical protein
MRCAECVGAEDEPQCKLVCFENSDSSVNKALMDSRAVEAAMK